VPAAALTLSLVPSAVVAAVRHLAAQSFRRTAADQPRRTPPGLPPGVNVIKLFSFVTNDEA
jgi:hypothetical protein